MNELETREFGKYLKHIMNHMVRKIDHKVSQDGLTTVQGRVIGYLAKKERTGEVVFQRDVEEEFHIRRSSVTSVIQGLEKNEYITRESVAQDARLKKIILTDKGRKINESVRETIFSEERKILQVLTDEEKEQFFYLIEKLEKGLSNL